jgi:hypothetical protein
MTRGWTTVTGWLLYGFDGDGVTFVADLVEPLPGAGFVPPCAATVATLAGVTVGAGWPAW